MTLKLGLDMVDAFLAAHEYTAARESGKWDIDLAPVEATAYGFAFALASHLVAVIRVTEERFVGATPLDVLDAALDFDIVYQSFLRGETALETSDRLHNSAEDAARDFIAAIIGWLET